MIDVITEIAEDCQGFESSLLDRYYGLLIKIYLEFLKNVKWNMFLLIYCLQKKQKITRRVFTSHKVFKRRLNIPPLPPCDVVISQLLSVIVNNSETI